MIARVKGFAVLRGYRGLPRGDLRALAAALAALSRLALVPGPTGGRGRDQPADRESARRGRGRRPGRSQGLGMPYRALAQILGAAKVEARERRGDPRRRPRVQDALPRRHCGCGVARRARARRGAIVAGARRPRTIDLDRRRGRRGVAAQHRLPARRRRERRGDVGPAERLLPGARRLDPLSLQLPAAPGRGLRRARRGAGAQGRRGGERRLGGRSARGRGSRRGRLRRLRPKRRGLGAPPAGEGGRRAAADRNREDRRRSARAAARRARARSRGCGCSI